MDKKRPTIAELESILAGEGSENVVVLPSGEIAVSNRIAELEVEVERLHEQSDREHRAWEAFDRGIVTGVTQVDKSTPALFIAVGAKMGKVRMTALDAVLAVAKAAEAGEDP